MGAGASTDVDVSKFTSVEDAIAQGVSQEDINAYLSAHRPSETSETMAEQPTQVTSIFGMYKASSDAGPYLLSVSPKDDVTKAKVYLAVTGGMEVEGELAIVNGVAQLKYTLERTTFTLSSTNEGLLGEWDDGSERSTVMHPRITSQLVSDPVPGNGVIGLWATPVSMPVSLEPDGNGNVTGAWIVDGVEVQIRAKANNGDIACEIDIPDKEMLTFEAQLSDDGVRLSGFPHIPGDGNQVWLRVGQQASEGTKVRRRPLVVCGPSGVGKGTLIGMLMKEFRNYFAFSISHTSRGPREGEIDGVHYHFTDVACMQKDITDGKFVEHAQVHSNYYGTSFESVQMIAKAGKVCVLDIDTQGAEKVRATNLNPYFIFIEPPSMEILEKRLRDRKTETEDKIQLRLGNAAKELEYGQKEGNFHANIVNAELQKAYTDLVETLTGWFGLESQ